MLHEETPANNNNAQIEEFATTQSRPTVVVADQSAVSGLAGFSPAAPPVPGLVLPQLGDNLGIGVLNGMCPNSSGGLFDPDEVARTIELLLEPGQITELRVLDAEFNHGRPATFAGYFERDHAAELICSLYPLCGAKGIYFVPNPLPRDVLARANNQAAIVREGLTKNHEPIERRWILVDIDAVRLAGISSTDEEHQAALDLVARIATDLIGLGLPGGIYADSGNGAHLMLPCRLPNNDAADVFHTVFLQWLANRYNTPQAAVDLTTHNAARIWRLYGTRACKGVNSPELGRPHRLSQILGDLGRECELPIIPEKLVEIADRCGFAFEGHQSSPLRRKANPQPQQSENSRQRTALVEFLQRYRPDQHEWEHPRQQDGRVMYRLLECPFDAAHGRDAAVFDGPDGFGFHCFHNGCANRHWADFRELYEERPTSNGPDQSRAEGRQVPEIKIGPDEMRVTDETITALTGRSDIYYRGSMLVEILDSPVPPPGIVRPDGGIRPVPLLKPRLREIISSSAEFLKLEKKGGESRGKWVRARVPSDTVEQVAARGRWPKLLALEGIVSSPQFLATGEILISPGYDRHSGLFLELRHKVAPIPVTPTADDVTAARSALLEVIRDFPFVDPVAQSGWLALVLTSVARYAIDGPTPLFAFDANVRGSGKSLLADAAHEILTGRQMSRTVVSDGSDDNEMRKRITAALLAAEPMMLLDNLSGPLGCSSLDSVLTGRTWKDRILGQSALTTELPATTIWVATGNNLILVGDTPRRTLLSRLESPLENPELRPAGEFTHRDLLGWCRAERGTLAAAAVTLLRAWHVAGRSDMGLPAWGSFEAWSGIVRNTLVWAGLADPGELRQSMAASGADNDSMLLRRLLAVWTNLAPPEGWIVGEAIRIADGTGTLSPGNPTLKELLDEMAGDGPTLGRSKRIAKSLGRLRHRRCGGRMLDSGEDSAAGQLRWRVVRVDV